MPDDANVPAGFAPLTDAGAFVEHVGPLYVREHDGVIGVRVEARHLNLARAAMGGFLATLVDVAFGRAIRAAADGESVVATVSLTTDYLRPGPGRCVARSAGGSRGATGRLAFGDASVCADGEEIVRARAASRSAQRADDRGSEPPERLLVLGAVEVPREHVAEERLVRAARANNVIDDLSFWASTDPKICSARNPSSCVSVRAHSRSRGPSTGMRGTPRPPPRRDRVPLRRRAGPSPAIWGRRTTSSATASARRGARSARTRRHPPAR